MTAPPLVSVVIPVYNGSDYLTECVESVVAQEYESWECTIVDNASDDRTPEIAARFAARERSPAAAHRMSRHEPGRAHR